MFRNKHVYTCPDVIHERQVAKRNAIITLVVNVVFLGGMWAYGRRLEKQLDEELAETEQDLTPTE